MRWRGTLILALALLAAAFFLYREIAAEGPALSWQSVVEGPRATAPGDQITHLLSFDPTTVTAIRLQRGDQAWQTERRDGGWSGNPRAGDVDDFLADLLGLAEIMPIDVKPDELADHGLAPPVGVVELERGGQPPLRLLLGRTNPPATGVYAQLGPGGRVVLTGAVALWELDKMARVLSPTAAAP